MKPVTKQAVYRRAKELSVKVRSGRDDNYFVDESSRVIGDAKQTMDWLNGGERLPFDVIGPQLFPWNYGIENERRDKRAKLTFKVMQEDGITSAKCDWLEEEVKRRYGIDVNDTDVLDALTV